MLGVMACALVSTAGCLPSATHIAAPNEVPPFRIDVDASELHATNTEDADTLRKAIAAAIEETVAEAYFVNDFAGMNAGATAPAMGPKKTRPPRPGELQLARFKADLKVDAEFRGWMVPLQIILFVPMVGQSIWLPSFTYKCDVNLTLEIGARRYEVVGHEEFSAGSGGEVGKCAWNATQMGLAKAFNVDPKSSASASRFRGSR